MPVPSLFTYILVSVFRSLRFLHLGCWVERLFSLDGESSFEVNRVGARVLALEPFVCCQGGFVADGGREEIGLECVGLYLESGELVMVVVYIVSYFAGDSKGNGFDKSCADLIGPSHFTVANIDSTFGHKGHAYTKVRELKGEGWRTHGAYLVVVH